MPLFLASQSPHRNDSSRYLAAACLLCCVVALLLLLPVAARADSRAAPSVDEQERVMAAVVADLRADGRPIAALAGLMLERNGAARRAAAIELEQRAGLPPAVRVLLAMQFCLQQDSQGPAKFCQSPQFLRALLEDDASNEFASNIACATAYRNEPFIEATATTACTPNHVSTSFYDYSQELKAVLLEVLSKRDFNLEKVTGFGDVPIVKALPGAVVFAEAFVSGRVFDDVRRYVVCDGRNLGFEQSDPEGLAKRKEGLRASARRMLANGRNSLQTVLCAEGLLASLGDPEAAKKLELLIASNHGNRVLYAADQPTIAALASIVRIAAREGDAAAWPKLVELLRRVLDADAAARASTSESPK